MLRATELLTIDRDWIKETGVMIIKAHVAYETHISLKSISVFGIDFLTEYGYEVIPVSGSISAGDDHYKVSWAHI